MHKAEPVFDETSEPAQLAERCEIRRCTEEDAAVLALIGAATFLESYAGWMPGHDLLAHCATAHSREAYLTLLRRAETTAWLVELIGAPVGFAVITSPEMPAELVQEGDAELKRIYLFSKWHGTGLAKRLFTHVLEEARKTGARRVLLGHHPKNRRAAAFYAKQGFREIGRRTFSVGTQTFEDPVLGLVL